MAKLSTISALALFNVLLGASAACAQSSRQIQGSDIQNLLITATGTPTGRSLGDRASDSISVLDYGAKCDGVTNDGVALQAAFTAGGVVRLPAGRTCYSGAALTAPANTSIVSDGNPSANPASGAIILCTNAVTTTCLTLSSGTSGVSGVGGISARGIGVGFSGTPAAGSIAIKVATTWNAALLDVNAFNAAIGFEFVATGIYGISAHLVRVTTCQITDAHMVIDGFPELRGTQLRLGCNNDGVNSNDYIRLQNTLGGPSNSPNTVYIENSQFNAGGAQVGCWLHFVGISNLRNEFNFSGNHVEAVNGALCSDAASTGINRLELTGNFFLDNSSSHDFFALNAATAVNDWTLTGNQFNGWSGWTLAPSGQINGLIATGNRWNGPSISITGVSNSTIDFEGNIYSGVTLSGSFAASIVKGLSTTGSWTNSATGPIEFPVKTAWTPALQFGGAAVGMTYTTQTGNWQIIGKTLVYNFQITLSAVGSSTGTAAIIGLPQTCGNIGTAAIYNTGMSTLGGAPIASTGGATVNLYQDGATGVGTLSNSNFTATSTIYGTITCLM
jgi:hypothetical protein